MGLLRILLAISVIIAHTTPIASSRFLLGPLAVQTFYLLSGFYMAFILDVKYKKLPVQVFYINRFLRIFPTYWIIVLLSVIFSLATFIRNGNPSLLTPFFSYASNMNIFSWIYLLFSNLFIVGQDAAMFMGLNTQTHLLFFTKNFWLTSPPLHTFLLIPQAWTISLELMFYAIVPKLVKYSTYLLLLFIAVSILLRLIGNHFGLNFDPWTYRFFPFEISIFIAGILAYRYMRHLKKITYSPFLLWNTVLIAAIITYMFYFIPIPMLTKHLLYLTFVFFSIPKLFSFTSKYRWDQYLGQLSYPVYLSHFLILTIVQSFAKFYPVFAHFTSGLGITLLSLIFSIVITQFIGKQIDIIRQLRVKEALNKHR